MSLSQEIQSVDQKPYNYVSAVSSVISKQSSTVSEQINSKNLILQKIKLFRKEIIANTHKSIQSISNISQTLLSELSSLENCIAPINDSSLVFKGIISNLTLKVHQNELDEFIKNLIPSYMSKSFEIFEDVIRVLGC